MRVTHLALLLALTATASSCNENDDDTAAPSTNTGGTGGGGGGGGALTASTPASVQMTIDGTNYSYTEGSVYGIAFGGGGGIAIPPDSSEKTYSMSIYPLANDMIINFEVELGLLRYLGGQPNDATFLGFMPVGPVAYGATTVLKDKVKLSWWDADGIEWSTQCGGSGQPADSEFEITQVVDVPVPFNYTQRKMRVTFNCRLFNCSFGTAYKTVTNGTGVFHFDNL